MKRKTVTLPKSTSPRVDIMCGDDDTLEVLRFRRDLSARDGDMKLALACAIAIDKKRALQVEADNRPRGQRRMTMTFEISEDGLTACMCHSGYFKAAGSSTIADARAQARLMLAAPQLLEASRYAYEVLRDVETESDDLPLGGVASMTNMLEAAIAAAEGKEA